MFCDALELHKCDVLSQITLEDGGGGGGLTESKKQIKVLKKPGKSKLTFGASKSLNYV